MDIVVCLSRTRKLHDSIWVIVDKITRSAHFIPLKSNYIAKNYAMMYIDEILRWYGIPLSIISDRGAQLTSHLWRSFQKSLGTPVKVSTAFHPQTNGQAERTIKTLEDMLRACVIDFKGSWDDHFPLIGFSYNNRYNSSIGMTPFEALCGRRCRSPVGWFEVGECYILGPEIIHEAMEHSTYL